MARSEVFRILCDGFLPRSVASVGGGTCISWRRRMRSAQWGCHGGRRCGRGYSAHVPGMFKGLDPAERPAILPGITEQEHVTSDYHSTGLSLRAHPVSFYRDILDEEGVATTAALRSMANGDRVEVAGYVTAYQRPETAGGITFITLEDETDVANLVVYKDFMAANRKVILGSKYLVVGGRVERQGEVIHVKVESVRSLDEALPDLGTKARRFR